MSNPIIRSLATAVPARRYSQSEIFERFLEPYFGQNRRARAVFARSGIQCRHTVVDGTYYAQERSTQARNLCYMSEAVPLAEQAIQGALDAAGLGPEAVDDLIIVSCTGIDTPGLDLRLAGRMGLRADLRRATILGMGCYAAFPGLQRAREAVLVEPGRKALVLAVELCSLHFQPDDDSMENIVASALFADGAAAVVIENASGGNGNGSHATPMRARPKLLDLATHCDYTTLDHMAFQLTNHGFRMRLSAYVPDVLEAEVEGFIAGLLARNGLARQDVRHWAIHPGGKKILDHVQTRLALSDRQMAASRAVLRDYGNMSSPTVLFVLDEIERQDHPAPGEYGVLMAFGPGLTMESALVQW